MLFSDRRAFHKSNTKPGSFIVKMGTTNLFSIKFVVDFLLKLKAKIAFRNFQIFLLLFLYFFTLIFTLKSHYSLTGSFYPLINQLFISYNSGDMSQRRAEHGPWSLLGQKAQSSRFADPGEGSGSFVFCVMIQAPLQRVKGNKGKKI